MAGRSECAADVAEIVAKIETDNPAVLQDMAAIVAALPVEIARGLVPRCTQWVRWADATWLPVRQLSLGLQKMIEAADAEAAVPLVASLLQLRPRSPPSFAD